LEAELNLDPDSNPDPNPVPESDPELITDPDPNLQIISDPSGSGSGCTTLGQKVYKWRKEKNKENYFFAPALRDSMHQMPNGKRERVAFLYCEVLYVLADRD
jgi:hypothetical protein